MFVITCRFWGHLYNRESWSVRVRGGGVGGMATSKKWVNRLGVDFGRFRRLVGDRCVVFCMNLRAWGFWVGRLDFGRCEGWVEESRCGLI